MLIAARADVGPTTISSILARENLRPFAQALTATGADVNANQELWDEENRRTKRRTTINLAREMGNAEIIKLIEKALAAKAKSKNKK